MMKDHRGVEGARWRDASREEAHKGPERERERKGGVRLRGSHASSNLWHGKKEELGVCVCHVHTLYSKSRGHSCTMHFGTCASSTAHIQNQLSQMRESSGQKNTKANWLRCPLERFLNTIQNCKRNLTYVHWKAHDCR